MRLHSFWRSSAAYRVRIALAIKGISYETVSWHLGRGEQRSPEYVAVNPQGLVPLLEDGDVAISQSLAIIEYLDETHPEPPLLPADPRGRAIVRSMAEVVACDTHPLNNLRVLNYLRSPLGHDQPTVDGWYHHWIAVGLSALESLARLHARGAKHLHDDRLSLADVVLVPQLYNARRLACPLDDYPTLVAIDAHLRGLPAFAAALPERQPGAE
jgi:maleylacetoacetate isomerase